MGGFLNGFVVGATVIAWVLWLAYLAERKRRPCEGSGGEQR